MLSKMFKTQPPNVRGCNKVLLTTEFKTINLVCKKGKDLKWIIKFSIKIWEKVKHAKPKVNRKKKMVKNWVEIDGINNTKRKEKKKTRKAQVIWKVSKIDSPSAGMTTKKEKPKTD